MAIAVHSVLQIPAYKELYVQLVVLGFFVFFSFFFQGSISLLEEIVCRYPIAATYVFVKFLLAS